MRLFLDILSYIFGLEEGRDPHENVKPARGKKRE